ncbi:unnamed protein product [Ascophyllum nodosum]
MNAFLARRDRDGRAWRRLREAKEWIDGQSSTKMVYWERIEVAYAQWREQAATIIQASFRGWEGRQIAVDRRARREAARCIQRRYRGFLGRRRASEERLRRLQVVPTPYAMKLLIQRSREAQRVDGWVEYFDPDTSAFWYFEVSTKRSTWDAPKAFYESMTCVWDPWPVPYSSPLDKPCRKVFTYMVEFQSHRLHAHPWQCEACGQRNTSVSFPRCELCGNSAGPDGENLEKAIEKAVGEALRGMRNPHAKIASGGGDTCKTNGTSEHEQGYRETRRHRILHSRGREVENIEGLSPPHRGGGSLSRWSCQGLKRGKEVLPQTKDVQTGVLGGVLRGSVLEGDSSVGESDSVGATLRVCRQFTKGTCSQTTCPYAHPGIRDDVELKQPDRRGFRRGFYTVKVCPQALANALGDGDPCPSGQMCKMYHPYVRPATAEIIDRIYPKRSGERTKVYPSGATLKGVVVNEVFQGYGVYTWPSGDVFMGQWRDGVRQGRGIFRSSDGREYIGSWENNVREGHGILTHPNGDRYEGQFHRGKVHGVGFLSGTGGDSFQGEFRNGQPEGIGCFRRKNGDKYNGHIRGGAAHGVGVLAYASGEKYKGDFRDDMRCGRGVCCYSNGSKFAGYWERNIRQGFGVFVSPDGRERYTGQWQNDKKHGYGRYIFASGDIYDGEFIRDQAWGQGVYRYAISGGGAGDYYLGSWESDRRHGKGILRWANGSRFEGYWKAGDIDGKGVFDYACGDCYRGEFKTNKKHGTGVFTWANGNKYTGQFNNGVIEGHGEIVYKTTGHQFKGLWKNNRKHGMGTFRYADGHVYSGDFTNDKPHGMGRLTFFPGSILEEEYMGEFCRGVKHGRGVYVYRKSDGWVYDGDWKDGLWHGEGLLRYANCTFYKGEFNDNRKHGTGGMLWADGSQYYGSWVNNLRHGEGAFLHTDGSIYKGCFRLDKKSGPGTLTFLDGNCYEGEWKDGKMLGTKGRCTLLTGPADGDRLHLRVIGY